MKNVTTLVLGGGQGTRLYPLTKYRSKPAVPLAAKYRLIDIPLSNCINSGMNRIYVLTQFMSVSLHRHIRQTYRFDAFSGGFVELLAAQQTMDAGIDWYEGTADAVRKNMKYFDQPGIDYVVILSGDQLYRMDYREMIKTHQDTNADVTIAALPVSRQDAGSLGVMRIDDDGRVAGFLEKPQTDEEIDIVRTDPAWIDAQGIESKGRECLASMGIYVFNREFLVDVLTKTAYQDFGKEVFPAAFRTRRVQAHLYDDYWEDIGTIKAFYDATLSLASSDAPFDFYSPEAPIYSRARFLPPTIVDGASISGSTIADGCKIGKGAVVENSVIGLRCNIGENVTIRNSIIMGADFFDTESLRNGQPAVGIGNGSVIEGAILDKNCRVGQNVRIINEAAVENSEDAEDCVVRDHIPIVLKEAVLADGWTL
ncbi:MAG: glucose-1-phosphate adenylyltransferase [Planctomycetes bacterium]|nr:glucose-1-phosphate adenylyltransferase [Planctomycetota bacterium]